VAERDTGVQTRAGFVTLLGLPNAGKSTLLNAMMGERLSIVSARPQTTWRRITGIHSDAQCQIVFLDTPGLLDPQDLIHEALMLEARSALGDADLVLAVLDPTRPIRELQDQFVAGLLEGVSVPKIVAVTKTDLAPAERVALVREWAGSLSPVAVQLVSGQTGEGVPELLGVLKQHLPESPFYYPDDEIATAPVRFFVGELVRETVFDQFREEIPYATFCEVEDFREGGGRTYIQVNIFVERASQKGILIGERGAAIRTLGRDARAKIEAFLEQPVYLDLWVKVLPKWRKKRGELRRLGLPIPEIRRS